MKIVSTIARHNDMFIYRKTIIETDCQTAGRRGGIDKFIPFNQATAERLTNMIDGQAKQGNILTVI